MLFDPFEEQFNFPAVLVKQRYLFGRQIKIICYEHKMLLSVLIIIFYSAEGNRILVRCVIPRKYNRLIAKNSVFMFHFSGFNSVERKVFPWPCHKKRTMHMDG